MKCPAFCRLRLREGGGNAVKNAVDVDVDHIVPLVHFEAFEGRLLHQVGIVEHDVDASEALDGDIDQALDLRAIGGEAGRDR